MKARYGYGELRRSSDRRNSRCPMALRGLAAQLGREELVGDRYRSTLKLLAISTLTSHVRRLWVGTAEGRRPPA